MNNIFIGIDPGITGAVAVLNSEGDILLLEDLPVMARSSTKRSGRHLNGAALATLLSDYAGKGAMACIEQVGARPRQGTSSTFSLGDSYGVCRGVLAALRFPTKLVMPIIWKRHHRLTLSDKEGSRARAIELFPSALLHRKADHNRAEALLIASYLLHGEHHEISE